MDGLGRLARSSRGWALAAVAVAVAGWLAAMGPARAASVPFAGVRGPVQAVPTAGGADVSWSAPRSRPSYYRLSVRDLSTGSAFAALTHGPYRFAHLSDLAAGHTYLVSVAGEPTLTPIGSTSVVPTAAPLSTLPPPTSVSIARTTLPGGAPGLMVHASLAGARYIAAEALTLQTREVAARSLAAPGTTGSTVLLGPLAPATAYLVGVAGRDANGQGAIRWSAATTAPGNCGAGVCVTVSARRAGQRFAADGVLDAIPTSALLAHSLHPAVFRVNTGYGSRPGATRAVAATGASLIENLADAWFNRTDSGLAGGAEPPWECWSCYQRFVADQARRLAAEGARPAYWEVMNEPGSSGTYPSHLNGDAALYLGQLQVAARAIRSVYPRARILAPTDGRFVTGGTRLDQPYLTLDAVLANARSIPGLAGLDWHEISGGATPAVAAADVAAARRLARIAGVRHLAMVVGEYTTPADAAIPGSGAAWLASLTDAAATYAIRACWADQPVGTTASTCSDQLADGLVTSSGQLTGPGLVSSFYRAMANGDRRLATSNDPGVSALASVSRDGTAQILLGSVAGCLASGRQACPDALSAPRPVTVTVAMPSAGTARVLLVTPSAGAATVRIVKAAVSFANGVATTHVSLPYGAAGLLVIS